MSLKSTSGCVVLLVFAAGLAGCTATSTKQSWWQCAIAGAAVGGAGGAMSDREAAAWGAVGGALIGGIVCALSGDEEDRYQDDVACDRYDCLYPAGVEKVDEDEDGVLEHKRCLNTPPGVPVDEYGCPMPAERMLRDVTFMFDSSDLTDQAKAVLDQEAAYLKKYPDAHYVLIGHSDSTGPEEYNIGLSRRRADAVMDYLIRQGVKAQCLSTSGVGSKEPVVDDSVPGMRVKNRRVEIRLMSQ